MSGIHLNDLSKIYREQIVEKKDDTYLEPDMKKRQKNNEKARKELAKGPQMKNPHFEEVEVNEADSLAAMAARREKRLAAQRKKMGTSSTGQDFGHDYGISSAERKKRQQAEFDKFVGKKTQKEGLDPVNPVAANKKFANRQDKDLDNDGDTDTTDKYLHKRRKAIGKAIKKKMSEGVRDIDPEKGTAERKARLEKKRGMKMDDHPQYKKEEYIPEVMTDSMDEKPIKEKKVKNVVKINPKLGESVEEIGGELIEAVEIVDILEEITDQELRFISDKMIDEIVEEFFIEAAEQDDDLEVLQQNLCESIDLSISLLLEQDAGAEARKRLGSGPSRASVMDRVKSAVKKHGPTVKAGIKKAGKAVAKGAGYAAGAAVRGAKAAGREFSKGYERGRQGSSGSSDSSSSSSSSDSGSSSSSSSSSDSGSSSAPKKPGLLSRIGAKLKKGIGKAARAVSRGARNVARKMDEEIINERGDYWHPDPDEDKKLGGPGANQRAREDRGSSKPAAKKDYSKSLKPGESYMQFAKRKKAEKTRSEGYGAPGHNPGSGEKSVARAKALMDKKGQKGAPGLDAMMAAKKEHEAKRGVKKEEVEVDEAMRPGPRQRKMAAKMHDPYVKGGSKSRGQAHNIAVRGDVSTGDPAIKSRGGGGVKKDKGAGYGDRGAGNKARRRAGDEPMRGNRDPRNEEFAVEDAAMSPQEIQMQKKKAMIDKMIASKRMQGLKKSAPEKEAPAKAMGEEASDAMKDRRMERGGVGGNVDYKRAPKPANTAGKKKPYDGMSALDFVKADIRKKHGKGAIIDTKKK